MESHPPQGRTSNTDLGVVVSLLDGGKVRIRRLARWGVGGSAVSTRIGLQEFDIDMDTPT